MIIGVTGKISTGKDTVAKHLEENGFEILSLSDEIRGELRKEGKEFTRENQQEKGDELRKKYGTDILAKRAIGKMEKGKDYVIVSIRNPGEVEALRDRDDFILVNVTAPSDKRLEMAEKAREVEERKDTASSLEEFRKMDERESSSESFSQQLDKVAEMADRTIANDGTISELRVKCEELLDSIRGMQ